MKNGMKYAAVFVGTVIGAGFATGREIALYFKGANALTAAAAGIMLGLLCGFFMLAGRRSGAGFTAFLFGRSKKIFDGIVFACAFVTFIAMYAGARSIFQQTYGIGWLGFATAAISVVAAILGLTRIKLLNLVLVPLILAFVVLIYIKNGVYFTEGKALLFRPVAYGALNIMLGGYVMAEYGKDANRTEICWATVFSGVVLAVMLYMIKATAGGDLVSEMPLYAVAVQKGLGKIAALLIFFAILTTMVSAAKVMLDGLGDVVGSSWLSGLVIVAVACFACVFLSFSEIVDRFYPTISAFGVLLILLTVFRFLQKKRLPDIGQTLKL